jgi:hypothetical protein
MSSLPKSRLMDLHNCKLHGNGINNPIMAWPSGLLGLLGVYNTGMLSRFSSSECYIIMIRSKWYNNYAFTYLDLERECK